METREILIANTKTQQRTKLSTAATTLEELKADLANAGIDYSGMSFTEGITKTTLLDGAQLPQNVNYRGNVTNNLVILLTNTTKNIASGACLPDNMSRREVYQLIRENNFQDSIKEEFGRNFTQVPTSDLVAFIEEHTKVVEDGILDDKPVEEEEPIVDVEDDEDEVTPHEPSNPYISLAYDNIKFLLNIKALSLADLHELIDVLQELHARKTEESTLNVGNLAISEDELSSMMASI